MNKFQLPIFLALSAGLLLPAAANFPTRSSLAESRGYQSCSEAAQRAVEIRYLDSDYYIYEYEDTRRYYMNGFALLDGASTAVKIACLTSVNGHQIEDFSIGPGEYRGRRLEQPLLLTTEQR